MMIATLGSGGTMEEYAHRRNVERFERELASEGDPGRRKFIESLLETEREQLARVIREKASTRGKTT